MAEERPSIKLKFGDNEIEYTGNNATRDVKSFYDDVVQPILDNMSGGASVEWNLD